MKPLAPVTRTLSPDPSVHSRDRCSVPLAIVLPNSKIRLEPFCALAKHVVEGVGEKLDLVVPGNERRKELDHVHVVGRHLREDPVAMEERDHDHLGEQRRTDCLDHAEPTAQARGRGLAEDQPDHQAPAPHLVQELVAFDQWTRGPW